MSLLEPADFERLTDRQANILSTSWTAINKNREAVAVAIFQMIFELHPVAKDMFPFARRDGNDKVMVDKQLKFHANRFMQLFDQVIGQLGQSPGQLYNVLFNLGSVHEKVSQTRGFHLAYWSVFTEATIWNFRKQLKKAGMTSDILDESVVLWRSLLAWTMDIMQGAFEAKRCLRRESGRERQRARNRSATRESDVDDTEKDYLLASAAGRHAGKMSVQGVKTSRFVQSVDQL